MRKYLLILSLSLLLLWGGLAAATLGGNALLGKKAIPGAFAVARTETTYQIRFLGKGVRLRRALVLGQLAQKDFLWDRKLKLGRLDQLIILRNRWQAKLFSRKRGENGE